MSHLVVFYNERVIYSVNNRTYVCNQHYKLGYMFRFTEPSSGQFLKQSNGTFNACAHYAHALNVPLLCFRNWPEDGSSKRNM